jgi:hypothetical protein
VSCRSFSRLTDLLAMRPPPEPLAGTEHSKNNFLTAGAAQP